MQNLMIQSRRCPAIVIVLLGLLPIGCGGGAPAGPERATIKGTATLDGLPINGGTVTFQNTKGAAGGAIANGAFEFSGDTGAVLGDYTARFSWLKPTGKKMKDPDTGEEIEETAEVIPDKYNAQSGERVTVKAGENVYKFELKTK